jgi:hypothetical protein
LGGQFVVHNNPGLTKVVNPVSSIPFNDYALNGCNITGTLDVSGLTGLGGLFLVQNNYGLTKILNPVSSEIFSNYNANTCNLTGTLDVSGLSNLGGDFNISGNANLNYILHPGSTQGFYNYAAYDCGLIGTLDVSALTGLGGSFQISRNPSLNKVLFPKTPTGNYSYFDLADCGLTGTVDLRDISLNMFGSQMILAGNHQLTQILNPRIDTRIYNYYVYDCSLITLDISTFNDFGQNFLAYNNINLSHIIFPTFTRPIEIINVYNCALDQETVDSILAKVDAYYSANVPTTNIVVHMGGSNNSWPSDGSSNTNLQNILSIFAGQSLDASITFNDEPILATIQTNAYGSSFDPMITVSA